MGHLLISAAHKSSGKTTISLGLCAALARRGRVVQPFKKGPDYIDPMWLSRASGRPCYNLDFHTMGEDAIRETFGRYAHQADISVIEGNMGLFDGTDIGGTNSNAALARLLEAPVLLVLDTRGMTRTAAAIVAGLQGFDPAIRIAGVILNKVAGSRHESKLRSAIEYYTDARLVGAVHRNEQLAIDERHLGLIPSNEESAANAKMDYIADSIAEQVDLDQVMALADEAPSPAPVGPLPLPPAADVRIGIARDAAFGFYYPDDLEKLRAAGADLIPFDTLEDRTLPAVDGLLIGGGFPETSMERLEANRPMREAIRQAVEAGMPVYAECGGLMYMTRSIRWGDRCSEMVGVIPADTVMHERPVGRGYVRLRDTGEGPWPGTRPGTEYNAHEFHYSSLANVDPDLTYAYDMLRGKGVDGSHDGIVHRNLLANYTHLRDVRGNCDWADRFVAFVREHRKAAHGARHGETANEV